MKLIIAGSRTITGLSKYFMRDLMNNLCIDFNNPDILHEVVSGTANGVDIEGERFARSYNIPLKRFPADWDKYGNAAGPIRNKQMADYADALLLIWTGDPETSRGSYNMKNTMLKLGKPVYEIIIRKENV